ncbi:hypothetical protein [Halostagnicola sp. A-GB9-2]|uniref:hypothetical protein n=1 Tax=Halostagnicola sp. A-GB9-2 TaxID=3048066 RepID=UPI0024BFDD4A|nr:hypothetical protein [Halostagnicola sp. A-GB9-2]MDJ1431205.1 hypothetical protein [Halostagnicola sp. A-GB9-2]
MTGTRGVAIVVLIAVVGLAIAPLATAGFSGSLAESAGGVVTDGDDDAGEEPVENDAGHGDGEEGTGSAAGNGSSPETNVTEFMQSSAAETETTVETGLFNASYNNADNESREAIVTERADTIEKQIADLEDEKNELEENEDEMSSAAHNARMTRLTVQISSLENSIESVEHRASDIGLNMSGLDTLRTSAADLTGPSVAEVATNLVGVDMSPSFSDGIQEQVNDTVPSPDLGDVGSPNLTDDSVLPTDRLSSSEATDDMLDNNTSSEFKPDEGEVSELVEDERIEDDVLEDEEIVLNGSEDNESVIDERVIDERVLDDAALDENEDNESVIDRSLFDESTDD